MYSLNSIKTRFFFINNFLITFLLLIIKEHDSWRAAAASHEAPTHSIDSERNFSKSKAMDLFIGKIERIRCVFKIIYLVFGYKCACASSIF